MTLPSFAVTLKPDFLVIGAMKCATSTVATYLENHPDVDMVKGCEPRYFSRDDNYAKGMDWYGRFFEEFSGTRLIGEGSNEYVAGARYPDCAARIAVDLPDVKLVMMVQRIGKKISRPMAQAKAVLIALRCGVTERAIMRSSRLAFHRAANQCRGTRMRGVSDQLSRFFPTMRIRKMATMLARMMA